jgi:hypothetical protein
MLKASSSRQIQLCLPEDDWETGQIVGMCKPFDSLGNSKVLCYGRTFSYPNALTVYTREGFVLGLVLLKALPLGSL